MADGREHAAGRRALGEAQVDVGGAGRAPVAQHGHRGGPLRRGPRRVAEDEQRAVAQRCDPALRAELEPGHAGTEARRRRGEERDGAAGAVVEMRAGGGPAQGHRGDPVDRGAAQDGAVGGDADARARDHEDGDGETLVDDDPQPVRRRGVGADPGDDRERLDRPPELRGADVEGRHVAGGRLQRAGDPGALRPARPRDGDLADGDERRLAQPEPAPTEQGGDGERDEDDAQAWRAQARRGERPPGEGERGRHDDRVRRRRARSCPTARPRGSRRRRAGGRGRRRPPPP